MEVLRCGSELRTGASADRAVRHPGVPKILLITLAVAVADLHQHRFSAIRSVDAALVEAARSFGAGRTEMICSGHIPGSARVSGRPAPGPDGLLVVVDLRGDHQLAKRVSAGLR